VKRDCVKENKSKRKWFYYFIFELNYDTRKLTFRCWSTNTLVEDQVNSFSSFLVYFIVEFIRMIPI